MGEPMGLFVWFTGSMQTGNAIDGDYFTYYPLLKHRLLWLS
jgi:hypothetical protein